MKRFLNIVLFIVIWFLSIAVLMYVWLDIQGNELAKFPSYYFILSLVVSYILVYRFNLLDKFKNIKIPKASTNKKNDIPIKIDSKIFGVIGVIILIGGLYYYLGNFFKTTQIVDSKELVYVDDTVYWIKDMTLFSGIAKGEDIIYNSGDNIEAKLTNGVLDGTLKAWYENGQLYYEMVFKNGKPDGLQRDWYENGQLEFENNFKNGEYDGLVRHWNENGQLFYEGNYKNGEESGLFRWWYENEQLWSEENYKNGEENGLFRDWGENEQLISERVYKDDELISEKCWNEDGTEEDCVN